MSLIFQNVIDDCKIVITAVFLLSPFTSNISVLWIFFVHKPVLEPMVAFSQPAAYWHCYYSNVHFSQILFCKHLDRKQQGLQYAHFDLYSFVIVTNTEEVLCMVCVSDINRCIVKLRLMREPLGWSFSSPSKGALSLFLWLWTSPSCGPWAGEMFSSSAGQSLCNGSTTDPFFLMSLSPCAPHAFR